MNTKVNAALADIDEAITYFTERSDVGDGDDGQPVANEAMRHDMALTAARTTLAAHIAQQDATIARLAELVRAVKSSDYEISCADVSAGNWFDTRTAIFKDTP